MNSYIQSINQLKQPSFANIRTVASDSIAHLSRTKKDKIWAELNRGVALLNTHEQMCQYLFAYGNMHQAKLQDAFKQLPKNLFTNNFEIVDWGCGQGLGTINLFDYLNKHGLTNKVKRITLIEPSKEALERAVVHVNAYLEDKEIVNAISSYFEQIQKEQIISASGNPVIHIFSNILDVTQIDLKRLAGIIDSSVVSENYLVCVGPLNPNNLRIDAFYNYFNVTNSTTKI